MKSIQYDFNVTSIASKESFMKYDSYRRSVIQHAAISKGYLIGLTMGERSPYLVLKKYGVALMPKVIEITNEKRIQLESYIKANQKNSALVHLSNQE